jgi:hypothetical protein
MAHEISENGLKRGIRTMAREGKANLKFKLFD